MTFASVNKVFVWSARRIGGIGRQSGPTTITMAEDLQILVRFTTKLPKELRVPEAPMVRPDDALELR